MKMQACLFPLFSCLTFAASLHADTKAPIDVSGYVDANVHVDISGLRAGVGQVVISVWDSEENYLQTALLTKILPVESLDKGLLRVTFNGPLPRECVINAFYDINSNGELDTNWAGIPNEPVGITNNAKGRFGPPSYDDGKVIVSGHEQVFVITVDEV